MKPRKKGQQWEISYRCPGFSRPIYERFPTFEAAKLRIAEIEYEKSIGQLRPPKLLPSQEIQRSKKFLTVAELLDEYVQLYGLNHWGDSYLSYARHRINHYIKLYLGNVLVQDLTTHDLDIFYNNLRDKPAIVLKGHKDAGKTISPQVIEKIHTLLRSALSQAITWGYIQVNPAQNATLPEYEKTARAVWTADEAQRAVDLCDDPILRLALLLALGCSMRIGEILGLTWECVQLSEEDRNAGTACVLIDRELKRCDKSSLQDLERRGRSKVRFIFPEVKRKQSCKTVLVLKAPKTASSIRNVYLPETVSKALLEMQARQAEVKAMLGAPIQTMAWSSPTRTDGPMKSGRSLICCAALLPRTIFPLWCSIRCGIAVRQSSSKSAAGTSKRSREIPATPRHEWSPTSTPTQTMRPGESWLKKLNRTFSKSLLKQNKQQLKTYNAPINCCWKTLIWQS